MAEILLCSETFVKSVSSISDNVAGKYIQPSIREAQEIGLKSIVGSCLLEHLKNLFAEGQLADQYKDLVDRAQYFLAYTAIVELTMKVSFKVGNFGVSKSQDENLNVATFDEIGKLQYYYQSKADSYTFALDRWLLDKAATLPELTASECGRVRSHLRSAASCGVFLGGARGKIIRNW